MTQSKKLYSKGNPERDVLPKREIKPVAVDVLPSTSFNILSPDYQKLDIGKEPKAFFIIISGGEVREKDYFKLISIQDKFTRIKLEFVADPLKLSPERMFELGKYKKLHYETSRNEDSQPDQIYLVSDVDHFADELHRIKPKCGDEGFNLIVSNPCFEVWLYYAYHEVIPAFSLPDDPMKISGKFKGWLPSVIPGGIKPSKAILRIYSNIENAKKNYWEDTDGVPMLFSTNMYELAENLLPVIEPELTMMIEENRRREAEYRKKKKRSSQQGGTEKN